MDYQNTGELVKYNTITKQVSETVPGGIYGGIDYHGSPPADVAERAGWVDVTPEIQAQIDAAAAQAAEDAAAAELVRLETPLIYDQPIQARIEIPAIDGHVYGAEVDPVSGDVIGVQRESVRKSQAEYEADRDARFAARAARKVRITDAAKAVTAAKGKANGAGNSVASLRAAVADLAAAVESLTAEIN
ncbi:MAG: hypothetical protein KJ626_10235 [Verrucomicrobia bacterium]|nr:hypothetical protein [Verrucomicrobiota bacterium]